MNTADQFGLNWWLLVTQIFSFVIVIAAIGLPIAATIFCLRDHRLNSGLPLWLLLIWLVPVAGPICTLVVLRRQPPSHAEHPATSTTKTRPNKSLIIAGVMLLLCLPAFATIATIIAYSAQRQYFSKATLEFGGANKADLEQAFQPESQQYRDSATLRKVRNTDLYEIGVHDPNPQHAAEKANALVTALQQSLGDAAVKSSISSGPGSAAIEAQPGKPAVKIWERAEPSNRPARPNVPAIMFVGIGSGLFAALVGAVLLVFAFVSRSADLQSPPQVA